MSFLDLTTFAMHRRQELELRVNSFLVKCDQTINYIQRLKNEALAMPHKLNCDPSELKNQYIKCIMNLEEYLYLITDIDHALVEKIEEQSANEYTPSNEKSLENRSQPMMAQPMQPMMTQPMQPMMTQPMKPMMTQTNNLMDALSEPMPSTSTATNCYPAQKCKPKKVKKPNLEDILITFSSTSSSNESMLTRRTHFKCQSPVSNHNNDSLQRSSTSPVTRHSNPVTNSSRPNNEYSDLERVSSSQKVEIANHTRENDNSRSQSRNQFRENVQCELVNSLQNTHITGSSDNIEEDKLPAQSLVEEDHLYRAVIVYADGISFWVILSPIEECMDFIKMMTAYYKHPLLQAHQSDIDLVKSYHAYYDANDTDMWYRVLLIQYYEDEASVFLIDTGEQRRVSMNLMRPLVEAFRELPAFARCCHIAGVRVESEEAKAEVSAILKGYIGAKLSVRVDDVESESIGVELLLPDNKSLGDILVQRGLAQSLEDPPTLTHAVSVSLGATPLNSGPPETRSMTSSELELDMDAPEYEDPVEAVTGYSNRDEADICKHYKGGPDKTCFKGSRCNKKHIMHHPDGWTLDKVAVVGKCESLPVPAPDDWVRVTVTCVKHFDTVYVQMVPDENDVEDVPCFGIVRPPTTLASLVRDMNSAAQRMEYQPFTIAPAIGEIVAAVYPCDGCFYRARVLRIPEADKNVEVFYIDYGNILFLRENNIFTLPVQYAALPAQAMFCRLAGVAAKEQDSKQWATAKKQLTDLVLDKKFEAHVISRYYDEMTAELLDANGVNIAEELHRRGLVELHHYEVIDDSKVQYKVAPPLLSPYRQTVPNT